MIAQLGLFANACATLPILNVPYFHRFGFGEAYFVSALVYWPTIGIIAWRRWWRLVPGDLVFLWFGQAMVAVVVLAAISWLVPDAVR
jgi:hypothetical protein